MTCNRSFTITLNRKEEEPKRIRTDQLFFRRKETFEPFLSKTYNVSGHFLVLTIT